MLTLKEYFIAAGLDVSPDRIKLVKHVDHRNRSIRQIIDEGHFDIYQAEQGPLKKPFHNCDAIISFILICI